MLCKVRRVGKKRASKCNRCGSKQKMFRLRHRPKQKRYGEITKEYLGFMCVVCGYYDCAYVGDLEFQRYEERTWHKIQSQDKT